ncbi:MAG: carbohydrate kinase, partial [Paracoccus sp. (in: a-proteobacteria)]|nr:carbohydrate kinase [Paracoccus sp. (in: a-proteobacteria)]
MSGPDILVGIDAGTSVIKAVAFDLAGRQLGASSVPNTYQTGQGGSATQAMVRTWDDCATALRGLGERIPDLARRTAALSVTAQGDGTWLVGQDGPVGNAWLWLDARAAPTVSRLAAGPMNRARFEATGTGLNTCQQGAQMAHMDVHAPHLLDCAQV